LFVLSKLLEARTKGKTSSAIRKLIGLQPKTAFILDGSEEKEIPLARMQKEMVMVRPGERIPVGGEVIEGQSADHGCGRFLTPFQEACILETEASRQETTSFLSSWWGRLRLLGGEAIHVRF